MLLSSATLLGGCACAQEAPAPQEEGPVNSAQLGRASWTLLHTVASSYPRRPTEQQQGEMKLFLALFSKLYPRWYCAQDFQKQIKKTPPAVESRESLALWMCDQHNRVNRKIGKPLFDCSMWRERWGDEGEDEDSSEEGEECHKKSCEDAKGFTSAFMSKHKESQGGNRGKQESQESSAPGSS